MNSIINQQTGVVPNPLAFLLKSQLSEAHLQEEPVFLIDDFLVKKSILMIYASGGSGKSFMSLPLCLRLLEEKKIKKVFYLDMDNSLVALKKRGLDKILKSTPDLHYIHTSLLEGDPLNLLHGLVLEGKKNGELFKDTLIVLDSIRDFIGGRDMNSDRDVIPVMQMLKDLRESGATVVFLHHTSKGGDGKTFRGSSSFRDSVDIAYFLSSKRHGNELAFTLELDKDRLGVDELVAFNLDTKTMILEDTNPATASMDEAKLERANSLAKVINNNPNGICQSALIEASGKGFGDHKSKSILEENMGKLWDMRKGGKNNANLYYPLQNLQNQQKSA